ncbi:MAG TPA: BadF/BadG/BcrA/BcrD ATPase family protein [Candidatus Competibacteraceae bacterium]|nr:BadF/BadG/BcrA/BcrD ATPase family protein [Candidatus Competibacteraceae bacterium]
MSTPLYLGVDGGGTNCRARLSDDRGRILGEGRGGPANIRLGGERAYAAILEAARQALVQAGLSEEHLAGLHVGLGLAGVNVAQVRDAFLALPSPFAHVRLVCDATIACLGAHGGEDGGIVIIGTGSNALARVGGRTISLGGWGFELSDQGSGAVMGQRALRLALLAHQGLRPATALSRALMARWQDDPERLFLWGAAARPGDYAALMPLILEHAAACDMLALELLSEGAAEIGALVDALLRHGAPCVSLLGGLAGVMAQWLAPPLRARLVEPRGDALDGALLLARGEVAA